MTKKKKSLKEIAKGMEEQNEECHRDWKGQYWCWQGAEVKTPQ
jgi:hypothetical protein